MSTVSDDPTTVEASYQQTFGMANPAIEPELAGAQHRFQFENRQVVIALPVLSTSNGPPTSARQNPFSPAAVIYVSDTSKKPLRVSVVSIMLTIEGLRVTIPSTAAAYPGANHALFDEAQRRDLDERSDALYFLARRAVAYCLRVIWCKTGFYTVNQLSGAARGSGSDGGALVNTNSGTRFHAPRVGRTIVMRAHSVIRAGQWLEIAQALIAGQEPPVWYDYLASAHQRMEAGDRLAAMLDLAVAVEARIRTALDAQLPPGIPKGFRRAIRYRKMSHIFEHRQDYGLATFPDLPWLKKLFDIRNGIMHNGSEKRADVAFFETASKAVAQLLATL